MLWKNTGKAMEFLFWGSVRTLCLLYEEEERSIENVAFRNSLLYEVEEERSRENMALRTCLLYEEEEEYRKCGFQDLFAV